MLSSKLYAAIAGERCGMAHYAAAKAPAATVRFTPESLGPVNDGGLGALARAVAPQWPPKKRMTSPPNARKGPKAIALRRAARPSRAKTTSP